jgi:hypothetical protein
VATRDYGCFFCLEIFLLQLGTCLSLSNIFSLFNSSWQAFVIFLILGYHASRENGRREKKFSLIKNYIEDNGIWFLSRKKKLLAAN